MKKIYFTILTLFISLISVSQNSDLLGVWHLQSISPSGSETIITLPYDYTLSFEVNQQDSSIYNSNGMMQCNGYSSFTSFLSENTINIEFHDINNSYCSTNEEVYINTLTNGLWSSMEHIYFIIGSDLNAELTLINTNNDLLVFGKEPLSQIDIYGKWYLQQANISGEITSPPLTFEENYNVILDFETSTFWSNGPATDVFNGSYEINDTTIDFNEVSQTLGNICDHPIEVCNYFDFINFNILFDSNTTTQNSEFVVNYEITGSGVGAILTITNSFNSNYAIYGRQPEAINTIAGEWFLYSIWDYDIFLENPSSPISLTFENDDEIGLNNYLINDGCETTHQGQYINPIYQSHFKALSPSWSNSMDNDCENNEFINSLSGLFNGLDGSPNNNERILYYSVTGSGLDAELDLFITWIFDGTPQSIDAHFGRESLSNENFKNKLTSIFPNPVNDSLYLSNIDLDSNYSIYSIEGRKIITNRQLQSTIDVSNLNSGVYFLRIDGNQTIKFIKQ